MNKNKYIFIAAAVVLLVLVGIIGWDQKMANAPAVSDQATSINMMASTTTASTSAPTANSSGKTVTLMTAYTGPSFSFNYPNTWKYSPAADFLITNFGGKYAANGVIPAGGAQVNVATTTLSGPLSDIIDTESMSANNKVLSTVTVDKIACQKAVYEANYAPSANSEDISIYCSRGSVLYKIYLSYGANDPKGAAHITDFNMMLDSMKFLP